MRFAPFKDPQVKEAFETLPGGLRAPLMRLRQLILDTAAETAGVGELIETLKWREPAYLPKKSGIGTTIRINALKGSADHYAMYIHCRTTLIDSFRRHYPAVFSFEGNRAILLDAKDKIPEKPLKHCIAMALTYHARPKA
jgi:hypothetical protein